MFTVSRLQINREAEKQSTQDWLFSLLLKGLNALLWVKGNKLSQFYTFYTWTTERKKDDIITSGGPLSVAC